MLKQGLLLVLFSTAAIFFKRQLGQFLHGLLFVHNQLASILAVVFSGDATGRLIQSILALIIIPIIAGLIAILIFWLVKRIAMPHMMATIWVVWTVLLVTMLAQVG